VACLVFATLATPSLVRFFGFFLLAELYVEKAKTLNGYPCGFWLAFGGLGWAGLGQGGDGSGVTVLVPMVVVLVRMYSRSIPYQQMY
jgi:hypothetical protein